MGDIFKNISEKNKDKLLRNLEAQTLYFKKNCQISSSVKWDDTIGILLNGYMQITRTDYEGNKSLIEELEPGSVFGSIISNLNNSEYEIVTKEDSKIIVFEYRYLMNDKSFEYSYFNQFTRNLLEIIYEKINERNERISILTKKLTRDKLLEYFKIMSKKNGSTRIYMMMNYSELAYYLNIDRSAMSRELSNLQKEGFINKKGKIITLNYYESAKKK